MLTGFISSLGNSPAPGAVGNDRYTTLLLHSDDMTLISSAIGGTPVVCTPYNVSINTSVKRFNSGSLAFQGGGASYVFIKNSSDFDFGAGNFTIDWWEYRLDAVPASASIRRQADNVTQGYLIGHVSAGRRQVHMSSPGGSWDITATGDLGAIDLNTWTHLAVVRNGNVFTAYKNGIQISTWTSSLALAAGTGNLTLGHWNGNGLYGYMDEVRFSKGVARWTSNFSPPGLPYGPDPDYSAWHTVRLYHFATTNAAGAVFPDSSPYATGNTGGNGYGHPYNAFAGGPQGSQYFDAASFYNVLPGNEDLNFGNGDFTIDWWDWRSDAAEARPGLVRWTTTKSVQPWLIGWASGGNLTCYGSNDGTNWNILSAFSLGPTGPVNVWSHRAICRKSGVFYGFKDGVLQATGPNTLPFYSVGNDAAFVGVWNAEGAQYWGYGLMDELRISKGVARWTANFTPPTQPYT